MVGFDITINPNEPGVFLYRAGYTSFPTVAGGSVTDLNGVTDSGILLGAANFAAPGSLQIDTLVFTQTRAGKLTVLNDGTGFMQPQALSGRGDRVVGFSISTPGLVAWAYHAGVFTPLAVPGASTTRPTGVDNRGRVTGSFYTGPNNAPVSHGFVFENGTYKI